MKIIIWKISWPLNTYVKFNKTAYHIAKTTFKITFVNNYIQKVTWFFKISWSYTWTKKKTIAISRLLIKSSITKKKKSIKTENNERCCIGCFDFQFQISKPSSAYNLLKRLILLLRNSFFRKFDCTKTTTSKEYLSNLFKT